MITTIDITRTVVARRAVARSAAVLRVLGVPMCVLGAAVVLAGDLPAVALVLIGVLLLWSAGRLVSGERVGALVCAGVALVILLLDVGGLIMTVAEGPAADALYVLLALVVFALPKVWLVSGSYQALRNGEPAVFRNLPRAAHRGGAVRALFARRRRPGVMRPLVGSITLLLVWIVLTPVTYGLVGFVFGPATASLYRRARVRAAVDAQSLLAQDTRAPILYLRSFADEDLVVRARWHWRRSLIDNLTLWHERLEEVIARQLAAFGPVIAIGMPGERYARLGAAREYVADDDWRDTVVQRMQIAGVIAVLLGQGAGLQWELTTAKRLGLLHKCVFVFPKLGPSELQGRWEALREVIGVKSSSNHIRVELSKALTARIVGDELHVNTGRRPNEWHYEVALTTAVEQIQPVAAQAH